MARTVIRRTEVLSGWHCLQRSSPIKRLCTQALTLAPTLNLSQALHYGAHVDYPRSPSGISAPSDDLEQHKEASVGAEEIDDPAAFHLYTMVVTSTQVAWYIDLQEVRRLPDLRRIARNARSELQCTVRIACNRAVGKSRNVLGSQLSQCVHVRLEQDT